MEKIIQKLKKNFFFLIVLFFIVLLGNRFRTYNYQVVPHPGETTDEYVFAWSGLSILQNRIPKSWTGVPSAYSNVLSESINVDSIYDKNPERPPFQIVSPWFDKPPGFSLIIGGFASLKGIKEFSQANIGIIRRPMLRIGILTTILIYLLALNLFNQKTALLSAFLYSIIPTTVISSRLVISENGYIPLYLGALILINYYLIKKKKIFLILASICCFIAITFKLSAISVLLTIIVTILLLSKDKLNQRVKDCITAFLIGMSGLLLFFIYGYILDWNTFVKVFFSQSNLFYGASSEAFYSAVVLPKIVKFFTDGWITLGWFSIFILSFSQYFKEKGVKILVYSVFSYLIVFLYFGSESYGWYRFPFYPFLIMATAKLFIELYKEGKVFEFFGLALLPFGTTIHKLLGVEGFQAMVPYFRYFILLTLGVFIAPAFLKDKISIKIKRAYIVLLFLILVYFAIKELYFYNYDNWFFVT